MWTIPIVSSIILLLNILTSKILRVIKQNHHRNNHLHHPPHCLHFHPNCYPHPFTFDCCNQYVCHTQNPSYQVESHFLKNPTPYSTYAFIIKSQTSYSSQCFYNQTSSSPHNHLYPIRLHPHHRPTPRPHQQQQLLLFSVMKQRLPKLLVLH